MATALCWPYAELLWLLPGAHDDLTWVVRANVHVAGWLEWCVGSEHLFVGYRPLTALSFAADSLVARPTSWGYRATDLALFGAMAAAAAATWRGLRPDGPLWAAPAVALIAVAHPLSALVVPFLSRRSYLIAMAVGLGAVALASREGRGARAAAACLGALAVLANEGALTLLPVLPLAAWVGNGSGRRRASLEQLLAVGIALSAVVGLRLAVLGGLVGGYVPDDPGEVVRAGILSGLFTGHGDSGRAWLALGLAGLVALGIGATEAAREGRPTAAIALGWIGSVLGFFAAIGTFTDRVAFFALPPLALLLVGALVDGLRSGAGVGARIGLAGALAVALPIGWHAPGWRGLDGPLLRKWRAMTALVEPALAAVDAVEEPAVVYLVMPEVSGRWSHRDALKAPTWVDAAQLGTDRTAPILALSSPGSPMPELWSDPPRLVLGPGDHRVLTEVRSRRALTLNPDRLRRARATTDFELQIPLPDPPELPVYVYLHGTGEAVRIR